MQGRDLLALVVYYHKWETGVHLEAQFLPQRPLKVLYMKDTQVALVCQGLVAL